LILKLFKSPKQDITQMIKMQKPITSGTISMMMASGTAVVLEE
jgi:hypothetical protein